MTIETFVRTAQDIMRKDVGVDGDAQRINQMVWLIFLKILDDKEQNWVITRTKYTSPIDNRLRWSSWAKNKEGMTGDDLINFVNGDLFPTLKGLADKTGVNELGKVIGNIFKDSYNYMKSGTLLRQVINIIEEDLDFTSSSKTHVFNDIYEKILSDLQSAGNAGEYYTPRPVTQFIIDTLEPKYYETLLDPACGTGGFLTCAIDNISKTIQNADEKVTMSANIRGVEKKPLPHMLAVTNLMLHDIEVPIVAHDNTLAKPLIDCESNIDIVATNPPFGGMEEDGIELNFPASYRTRETADLFMTYIMEVLRNGGRAGVVLPDGFLFGEGIKINIKRKLLTDFNLHTIVRLPGGVFNPYTGIKTNILFFTKGERTKDIWFFEHPYPERYKTYSKSKPMHIEEFDLEKEWWNKRKTGKHAWKVSVKDIEDRNYNLDLKNPHLEEEIIESPEKLMSDYNKVLAKIKNVQEKLKKELFDALNKAK